MDLSKPQKFNTCLGRTLFLQFLAHAQTFDRGVSQMYMYLHCGVVQSLNSLFSSLNSLRVWEREGLGIGLSRNRTQKTTAVIIVKFSQKCSLTCVLLGPYTYTLSMLFNIHSNIWPCDIILEVEQLMPV